MSKPLLLSIGASLLFAIGIATALADDPERPAEPAPTENSKEPPVREVPEALKSDIGAFRQAQLGSDMPPGGSSEKLAESGDAQPGENPELARLVKSPSTGETAHLWPMDDGVCVSAENVSGCSRLDDLKKSGGVAKFVVTTPQGTRVVGFALDGVDEVRFETAKGQETTAAVSDNFFSVEVADSPVETRWVTPEGRSKTKIAGE